MKKVYLGCMCMRRVKVIYTSDAKWWLNYYKAIPLVLVGFRDFCDKLGRTSSLRDVLQPIVNPYKYYHQVKPTVIKGEYVETLEPFLVIVEEYRVGIGTYEHVLRAYVLYRYQGKIVYESFGGTHEYRDRDELVREIKRFLLSRGIIVDKPI